MNHLALYRLLKRKYGTFNILRNIIRGVGGKNTKYRFTYKSSRVVLVAERYALFTSSMV